MYLYHMPFRLTRPVNDIEKATAYLTADQMIDYLLDDSEVLKSARDRVFQIEWQLSTATTGNVVLVSKKPLTNVELGQYRWLGYGSELRRFRRRFRTAAFRLLFKRRRI